MSDKFKETTFIKQVERTCKRDAYESVLSWARNSDHAGILRYLQQKIDGHNDYLNSLPLEYNYGTQTLGPKMQYTVTVTDSDEAL